MDFQKEQYKSPISDAMKLYVTQLYINGQYRDLVEYVDRMYGWEPGELKRVYTQEEAEFCLRQIVKRGELSNQ